jgi:transcriptional regulator with XRE-family HTH domain
MHEYFGEQLRKERKNLGLTVQVLSEICETSRSYITLIENGKRLPGKTILPKIAVALKLKTATVLNWYLEDIRTKMSNG